MDCYTEHRVRRIARTLEQKGVAAEVAARILEGGESITPATPPVELAAWLAEAMRRMEALLDEPTRRAVREAGACCLRGKRLALSRAIANEHETLEERIRAAGETPFVFGHSVTRSAEGDVLVQFHPEGQGPYRCGCIREVVEPMPLLYCYCCAGHVRQHLSKALDRDVEVTVATSVLASRGAEPCRFVCKLQGDAAAG